jgi:spermidine/putrescine transport system substrate-binding protein
MSEEGMMDPRRMQSILQARLTRRSMLKGAGTGVAAFSLAAFLAACGGGGGGGTGSSQNPKEIFSGKPGDTINFANWPLYIDYAKDKDGTRYSPSIKKFGEETGIDVNFEETIQSNEEFFGKIQPQLAAGDDTGWDIIVITGGTRQFSVLVENNWVYPLDHSKTPNFNANAEDWAKDPYYDPDNAHSMGWQSGLDVIGYNDKLVNGDITKLDDLANPEKVGQGSVGMLEADMPDFVMINLGVDPKTSGPAEWKEAAKWLQMQKDSGTVRQYYDQSYIDDLTAGNLAASMVWSGDVLYYSVWAGYTNLHNVFPEGGALLWIDNMLIPANANNPSGALELMDYYYDPEIAKKVTEWVLYMSPVKGVADLILQDADKAADQGYKGYAHKLYATAKNTYVFPDQTFLSNSSFGRVFKTDDEYEEWNSIFLPISQS